MTAIRSAAAAAAAAEWFASQDYKEGRPALMAKRKPEFRGV
jgi:1,4-dihydroxy-2-naphthoyl-CoA synthase